MPYFRFAFTVLLVGLANLANGGCLSSNLGGANDAIRQEEGNNSVGNSSAVHYFPPGSGFNGPTVLSQRLGAGSAAIAHWESVPFRTFADTLDIAVLAYHPSGIDRVEFSVDGGAWVAVSEPTLNPATNVEEYWGLLRASDFTNDRSIEIRAIAYPNQGIPKILQGELANEQSSMFAYVAKNGVQPRAIRYVTVTGDDAKDCTSQAQACRTMLRALQAAGSNLNHVEIQLGAGRWDLAYLPDSSGFSNHEQWLTITSIPTVDAESVIVTGSPVFYGIQVELLKLSRLSLVGAVHADYASPQAPRYLWLDQLKIYDERADALYTGAGSWGPNGGTDPTIFSACYQTDNHYTNMVNGPTNATLARNIYGKLLGQGHGSGTATLVNYSVHTIYGSHYLFPGYGSGPDYHGDIYQFYQRTSNVIIYGARTVDGGFISSRGFAGTNAVTHQDIAIVKSNVNLEGQWVFSFCAADASNNSIDNMVLQDNYLKGNSNWCGESNPANLTSSRLTNVRIANSIFDNGSAEQLPLPIGLPGIIY